MTPNQELFGAALERASKRLATLRFEAGNIETNEKHISWAWFRVNHPAAAEKLGRAEEIIDRFWKDESPTAKAHFVKALRIWEDGQVYWGKCALADAAREEVAA